MPLASPPKVVVQSWQCASSPDRDHHLTKVTPTPRRWENNHTHQDDCSHSSGMKAGLLALPTRESFSGDDTGKFPSSLVLHFWQMLHLTQLKPKAAPDWPTNTMRPNNAYNRQREPLQMTGLKGKNKNKNKNSSAQQQSTHNTHIETPLKQQVLENKGHYIAGHHRTS